MNPISEAGGLLRGRASETREKLGGAVNTARTKLDDRVVEHPVRALLIALGAGLVVGLFLGLGRKRRSE